MDNAISIFNNEQFGEIRVVMRGGEPWFVGADILRVLESARTAYGKLRDKEKGVHSLYTPGGSQEMTIVSESGFYRLVMRSDKQEALYFQDWVVEEVLPAVRKNGAYVHATSEDTPDVIMARGILAAQETIEKLKAKIEENADKVDRCLNYLTEQAEEKTVNWLAKLLTQEGYRFSDKQLFAWLRERGILQKQQGANWNVPYQRYIDLGWFKIKEVYIHSVQGYRKTTLVTELGMVELPKRIKKWCDRNMAVA